MRRSSIAAWWTGGIVGIGVCAASGAAHADCPLALVPAEASPPWAAAAEAARKRLQSEVSGDCGSVEVAVRPSGGALLTFTTTDGRRALRALMSPDELGPSLDALLVTLAPEPAPPVSPTPAPTAPNRVEPPTTWREPRVNGVPEASPAGQQVPSSARELHFQLAASGGVRLGFGGVYATPAIALRPSGSFGAWELAGAVEYDPSYSYLPGGQRFRLWSFIAGVQLGRQEPLGPFGFGYGLGLGVASIQEEANDDDGTTKVADFGQPRVSAYGRFVYPRRATWRGTFDVGLDAALGSIKKRATLRSDLPELPRWGVITSLGIETSLL